MRNLLYQNPLVSKLNRGKMSHYDAKTGGRVNFFMYHRDAAFIFFHFANRVKTTLAPDTQAIEFVIEMPRKKRNGRWEIIKERFHTAADVTTSPH